MLQMQEDNQTMHRQLQDQIEERDRVVTETLRAISESKKQIATNKKAESNLQPVNRLSF